MCVTVYIESKFREYQKIEHAHPLSSRIINVFYFINDSLVGFGVLQMTFSDKEIGKFCP